MTLYYTGVGSRQTPLSVMGIMESVAAHLGAYSWVLRSGGADGADTAFENGCKTAKGAKEIYIPWRGFNGRSGPDYIHTVPPQAFKIAERIHPAWSACSPGAKKLHARNVCQVLGRDLATPSTALICWTLDGRKSGGTRTAIVLADEHKIPVFNLATLSHWSVQDIVQNVIEGALA